MEGYIIHRKLIDAKEEERVELEEREGKTKPYIPLGYVQTAKGRAFKAISSVQCYRKLLKAHDTTHIGAFLSCLIVDTAGDDKGRMITWLELYVWYRLRRGIKPIPDDFHKAIGRATADKQIRAFKRKIKAVVERTLARDGDAVLFKPSKGKPNTLKGCGILGKLPTLSFNVRIRENEQKAFALALS